MKFCKKCGAIMMPKKEGSKNIMACTQCSYKDKEAIKELIAYLFELLYYIFSD